MKHLIAICLFFQVFSLTAFAQAYKYHTVAPEENVYRIAQQYNITVESIYKYNPDARNGVNVGSKLVIPLQNEAVEKPDAPVTFKAHKVEKKETLFSLSQRYNVSIDDIKRFNKQLYSKELQQGETINIPVLPTVDTPVTKAVAQPPKHLFKLPRPGNILFCQKKQSMGLPENME
ncbi:LysM peptidoglycan-binding domain-containing protein [Antarcticibacterium sp. 1MA-6-2]|uniref:LysM peptidoglycan-binding domain-containing protein n=1 Tax=Antarcticibacterium sp. 1MA-6-2 TaxID=2908210 RepID=UPI001F3F951F|nr:LysM peptidoglycan-binding domain-containing protein [Antarcticibacterium sp. 1MA-6-2]UJH92246.1 LysM peptidoglycan-binding domain-containing protein [Antarcticibacterium sp. 1MA-6-2]